MIDIRKEVTKILSFIHKHPALAYYRSNFSEFDTAFSTVGTAGATFIKLKNTIDTKIRTFITDCVTRYLCKCFIKAVARSELVNSVLVLTVAHSYVKTVFVDKAGVYCKQPTRAAFYAEVILFGFEVTKIFGIVFVKFPT